MSGNRPSKLACQNQKSKIKNQKSKIKNQNQKSKIKNQKSKIKIRNQKLKNQKSKIKNQREIYPDCTMPGRVRWWQCMPTWDGLNIKELGGRQIPSKMKNHKWLTKKRIIKLDWQRKELSNQGTNSICKVKYDWNEKFKMRRWEFLKWKRGNI